MRKPRLGLTSSMQRLLERDREFQRRLMALAPKQRRLAKLLNSPFFLWLLTVILITFGGSYLTKHHECMADAQRIADRFTSVDQEVQARFTAIVQTEANDLAKYKEEIAKFSYDVAFKGVSLQELMKERDRLVKRIDYTSISAEIDRHREEYFRDVARFKEMDMDDVHLYDQAFRSESLDLLSEKDLAGFRLFVFTLGSRAITNPMSHETPLPNCTFSVVVSSILENQQHVLTIKRGYQKLQQGSPFLTMPR